MLIIVSLLALAVVVSLGTVAVKRKRWWLLGTQVLVAAIAVSVLAGSVLSRRNPYRDMGIEFLEDHPGATGRHVTYEPVLASDMKTAVGPTIGADHGVLSFRDLNGDGWKEVIVQSSRFPFSLEGSFGREVLEFVPDSRPGEQRFRRVED